MSQNSVGVPSGAASGQLTMCSAGAQSRTGWKGGVGRPAGVTLLLVVYDVGQAEILTALSVRTGRLVSVARPAAPEQKAESVFRRLRRPTAALCAVLLVPALAAWVVRAGKADDQESSSSASAEASRAGATGEL